MSCGRGVRRNGEMAERPERSAVRELRCKDVILQYLSDYLDANLSQEAVSDFERHLESCAPCRAYVHTYARTHELVHQTGQIAMPHEMKAHLRRFLLARLSSGQP
jgi:anti-sigma factor RsiW